MALYMIGFISYGATLAFFGAGLPRLACIAISACTTMISQSFIYVGQSHRDAIAGAADNKRSRPEYATWNYCVVFCAISAFSAATLSQRSFILMLSSTPSMWNSDHLLLSQSNHYHSICHGPRATQINWRKSKLSYLKVATNLVAIESKWSDNIAEGMSGRCLVNYKYLLRSPAGRVVPWSVMYTAILRASSSLKNVFKTHLNKVIIGQEHSAVVE